MQRLSDLVFPSSQPSSTGAVRCVGADVFLICTEPIPVWRLAGSSRLDELLGGGLYPGEVCEVVGPSGIGKTQLCHTAAALLALRGQSVLYLDSANGFCATRLQEMLQLRGRGVLSGAQVLVALQRITVVPVFDAQQLLTVLLELPSDERPAVIVDAIGGLLGALAGAGAQAAAIMESCRLVLTRLAVSRDIPVLLTNHTVAGHKPALGVSWSYTASARVLLQPGPGSGPVVHVTLLRSTRLPVGSHTEFALTAAGPTDVQLT